jgi:hypothetical protein
MTAQQSVPRNIGWSMSYMSVVETLRQNVGPAATFRKQALPLRNMVNAAALMKGFDVTRDDAPRGGSDAHPRRPLSAGI